MGKEKADNNYFIDSDKLYDYYTDSLITTDEWEALRYKIVQELNNCDDEDKRVDEFYMNEGLPFLHTFEYSLEEKLIKSGLKKEWLNNNIWLKCEAYSRRNDYEKPEIASALSGLVSIRKLKELLLPNGQVDRNSIRVFLYSLEAIINIFRAGAVSELARKQVGTEANSKETRGLKQLIAARIIIGFFEKYPHRPKTLGELWNKIDLLQKGKPMTDKKTGKKYYVETSKNKNGKDVLLITGDGIKPTKPLKYARRSLYKILDHLRKQYPSKITQ